MQLGGSLTIIDHSKQLFPMVGNHCSNDAMFAMYRSSVSLTLLDPLKGSPFLRALEWYNIIEPWSNETLTQDLVQSKWVGDPDECSPGVKSWAGLRP